MLMNQATQVVIIEAEDERFDLCEKHMVELQNWLATKEEPTREKPNDIFGKLRSKRGR